MAQLLQVPGYISTVRSLVDGGAKVTVDCPELPPADLAVLFGLTRQPGHFVFKANERIKETDIPADEADVLAGQKTRSQRLRAVLAVYWDQQVDKTKYPSADSWYEHWMDRKIAEIKQELQP